MGIVYGQDIFRRTAGDHQHDVGFAGLVDQRELAPFFDRVLDGANGGAIFGKQVGVELVSVVAGDVDVTGVYQGARESGDGLGFGRGE